MSTVPALPPRMAGFHGMAEINCLYFILGEDMGVMAADAVSGLLTYTVILLNSFLALYFCLALALHPSTPFLLIPFLGICALAYRRTP